MSSLSTTADKAVNAYGGISLWSSAKRIEAEVSVNGLAFTLKKRPFFDRSSIVMRIHEPVSRITPIGNDPLISGILEGDSVQLKNNGGEILKERKQARKTASSIRKIFRWDDMDMAYFSNYAFWNYFTLPALLLRSDIKWKEVSAGVLDAEFPGYIPTHSRAQRFIFDEKTGLLRQHNYTANIISRLAKAANVVISHGENNGVLYPSRRKVTPINYNGKPLGFPELINIQVHEFSVQ